MEVRVKLPSGKELTLVKEEEKKVDTEALKSICNECRKQGLVR